MKVALLLALAAAPAAAQTQADMNRSAGAQWRAADAALNARYRQLMGVMAKADAVRDADLRKGAERADGDPGYRAALQAAQRAWLQFRDAQCKLAGFAFRGGSAQPMAQAMCLAEVTRTRTAELSRLQASLSPK